MEDTNIKFVGEVERHPELYNYTKPGYARKNVVEKQWIEVGEKFNLTANESKEKWRNLRNTFVKNLKSAASGGSAKKKKAYYLSEAMQFALPFVKVSGTTSGNLPKVPSHIHTGHHLPSHKGLFVEENESPDQPEMLSQHPRPSTSSPASPTPYREEQSQLGHSFKRKREYMARKDMDVGVHISEYFLAKKKYLEAKKEVVSGQSKALKMFLLSLIPDLEALTPDRIRTFKRETLALIEELSDVPSTNYTKPPLITMSLQSSSPLKVNLVQPSTSVEVESPLSQVGVQSLSTGKQSTVTQTEKSESAG